MVFDKFLYPLHAQCYQIVFYRTAFGFGENAAERGVAYVQGFGKQFRQFSSGTSFAAADVDESVFDGFHDGGFATSDEAESLGGEHTVEFSCFIVGQVARERGRSQFDGFHRQLQMVGGYMAHRVDAVAAYHVFYYQFHYSRTLQAKLRQRGRASK